MASTEDEFNETEDFDNYNPHPYQGGYDIALTYGEPLPRSSKTCYPLNTYSPPSSSPPLPLPSPSPLPSASPLPSPLPLPLPSPSPSPSPLPVHPPLPQPDPYDRGFFGYPPDIYQFGIWPFSEEGNGGCSYGYGYGYGYGYSAAEDVGYWNQLRRAGDYLFGYSEGLGERRIGVDSYGIPIYADKAQSQQPLTLHFDPATEHNLDYHETPYTSDRWPSSYVEKKEETYGHASYDWHHYEEPVQGRVEMMQPHRLTYHEQTNPQLEWHSSYTKGGSEGDFYGQPKDDCERQYSEQHQCIELEPYKPTWSQHLDNHVIYDGEASSQSYWLSSADGGTGDVGGAFGNENHTNETYYYEQPLSVQLEPFKPSWSQNPNFYEQPIEEASQSSWVDESKENGNQYFSSFLRYSQYDE